MRDASAARVPLKLVRQIDALGWDQPASADAILVLADAMEERGYPDLAKDLQDTADYLTRGYGLQHLRLGLTRLRLLTLQALRRVQLNRPPPETSEKRRARLFQYYRRQRLPAREAFSLAKRAENMGRLVAVLSDENFLFRHNDGTYAIEHVDTDGKQFEVYRADLERGVPDWIDVEDVANYSGTSPSIYRRRWLSRNPKVRAWALIDAASYHGWPNFDSYPLRLKNRREYLLRYRRRP